MTGHAAQQAIENGLRAVLSARQCPADFRHDLNGIWNHYQQNHHDPQDTALKDAIEELLNHTTVPDPGEPGQTTNRLTSYAARYQYGGAPRRMAPMGMERTQNQGQRRLTGADRHGPPDERDPGPGPLPGGQARGEKLTGTKAGRTRKRGPRGPAPGPRSGTRSSTAPAPEKHRTEKEMNTMDLLVCGGRDYQDYQALRSTLDRLHKDLHFTTIIHGAARGADSLAGRWARERNIPVREFRVPS